MQSFSLRDIELLTGIKAHTIHTWRKQHDFFTAAKKQGREYLYHNKDLQKMLSISFLYHNGWKISKITSLTNNELHAEMLNIELQKGNYKTYVQRLLSAAVDFNEAAFLKMLNQLIEKIGFEKTITDVCYPYLQVVDLIWHTKNVAPAQEHFSGYIIRSSLISETEKFSVTQQQPPELILFSPGNEHYELPLLYLNYLLRKCGWRVLYLGGSIKLADVKEAAQLPGIKYLYLHIANHFPGLSVDDYLENLRKSFPGKMIIASGAGIGQSRRSFMQLRLLKRDKDIHQFIKSRS